MSDGKVLRKSILGKRRIVLPGALNGGEGKNHQRVRLAKSRCEVQGTRSLWGRVGVGNLQGLELGATGPALKMGVVP